MVVLIRMPYDEMVARIKEKTGLSAEQITGKVEAKLSQLTGLISKGGAAYIVANELGIKLLEAIGKIKDIYPGMRNIELVGQVLQVFDPREFVRSDNSSGKVGSVLIGDETGSTRVVFWGELADNLAKMQEGNVIRITGGNAKENNRGFKEVHLNNFSSVVVNPPGVKVEARQREPAKRKTIAQLQENDENVEVLGTIIQVFDLKFFEVCPTCGSKATMGNDQWACAKCSKVVTPDYAYILNLFLDDGTENIRLVLFRSQAEKFLKMSREQIMQYRTDPAAFEAVKTALLGEQYRFIGRVKRNIFFDRNEIIAQLVFPATAEEIEKAKAQTATPAEQPQQAVQQETQPEEEFFGE